MFDFKILEIYQNRLTHPECGHKNPIIKWSQVENHNNEIKKLKGWNLALALNLNCYCLVAKSCLTLCEPMDCSTPGFPVLDYLLEFAQTHVY